jgi:hypothetical protein
VLLPAALPLEGLLRGRRWCFVRLTARECLTAHTVQTGVQIVGMLEVHLDRADEGVALLLSVIPHHGRQFTTELLDVRAEALVVVLAELDDEVVRNHRSVTVPDRRVVVALALERARDLDGLDIRLERLGEGAVDQALEPLLELFQWTHGHLLPYAIGRSGPTVCSLIVSTRGKRARFPTVATVRSVGFHRDSYTLPTPRWLACSSCAATVCVDGVEARSPYGAGQACRRGGGRGDAGPQRGTAGCARCPCGCSWCERRGLRVLIRIGPWARANL